MLQLEQLRQARLAASLEEKDDRWGGKVERAPEQRRLFQSGCDLRQKEEEEAAEEEGRQREREDHLQLLAVVTVVGVVVVVVDAVWLEQLGWWRMKGCGEGDRRSEKGEDWDGRGGIWREGASRRRRRRRRRKA